MFYNTDRRREGREQRRDAELRERRPWSFSIPRNAAHPKASQRRHNKARQAVPDASPLRWRWKLVANEVVRAETTRG